MTMEELALPIKGSMRDGPFGSNLKSSHFVDEGIKVIRTQNIKKTGYVDQNVAYITPEKAEELARYEFIPGDLVIAKLGVDPGVAAVIPDSCGSGIIPADVVRFRGNPAIIDHHYLARFLNSPKVKLQIQQRSRGSTRTRVNLTALKDILINVPSLKEQREIVIILDKADEIKLVTNKAKKLRLILVQSIFVDMFGDPESNPKKWNKIALNQLCSFDRKTVQPENIIANTNYIGLVDIEKETGEILNIQNVEHGELKSSKFKFNENSILYGKLRPYLNKVALPDFEGICSTDIIPIQPIKSKSNKTFISYLMKSKCFVKFAERRSSGANLPRISPKKLEKYMAICPPIELQNRFADIVKSVEKLLDTHYLAEENVLSITQEMLT